MPDMSGLYRTWQRPTSFSRQSIIALPGPSIDRFRLPKPDQIHISSVRNTKHIPKTIKTRMQTRQDSNGSCKKMWKFGLALTCILTVDKKFTEFVHFSFRQSFPKCTDLVNSAELVLENVDAKRWVLNVRTGSKNVYKMRSNFFCRKWYALKQSQNFNCANPCYMT